MPGGSTARPEGERFMDYSEVIEERKSTRQFQDKKVPDSVVAQISDYYEKDARRLVPSLKTQILQFGTDAREDLEGAAGYEDFMIGAPNYMVLLSEQDELAEENGGYLMEDIILKLTDLDLGTCWITFTDSAAVKKALEIDSDMDVVAIVAFGYGKRAKKRMRLNILSMSNVDATAKLHFHDPKRSIHDMVYLDSYGNQDGLDEYLGFYGDMLWEAFHAATLSPSYLNRQPYDFVITDGKVVLVAKPDEYTDGIDEEIGWGIVMLHFAGAASDLSVNVEWKMYDEAVQLEVPEGYRVIASCSL